MKIKKIITMKNMIIKIAYRFLVYSILADHIYSHKREKKSIEMIVKD